MHHYRWKRKSSSQLHSIVCSAWNEKSLSVLLLKSKKKVHSSRKHFMRSIVTSALLLCSRTAVLNINWMSNMKRTSPIITTAFIRPTIELANRPTFVPKLTLIFRPMRVAPATVKNRYTRDKFIKGGSQCPDTLVVFCDSSNLPTWTKIEIPV